MGVGFSIIADKNKVDKIKEIAPESFVLGELR